MCRNFSPPVVCEPRLEFDFVRSLFYLLSCKPLSTSWYAAGSGVHTAESHRIYFFCGYRPQESPEGHQHVLQTGEGTELAHRL